MSKTEIQKLQKEIFDKKRKLAELRKKQEPTKIEKEYEFTDFFHNKVKLDDLFISKDQLIVVHNMGSGCAWCTMWADGINGVLPYLETKADVVLMSPQHPNVQRKLHMKKYWEFRMVSTKGNSFREDMGFGTNEDPHPGVSTFVKKEDGIYLVNSAEFGPGDNYCITYDLWDLLPQGWNEEDDLNIEEVAFDYDSGCACGGDCNHEDGHECACGGHEHSHAKEGCCGGTGGCACGH